MPKRVMRAQSFIIHTAILFARCAKLENLRKIFGKYFELKPNEGKSKVVTLKEAVREYVKPDMHVYFAYRPFGVVHEIVRQFHGHDAGFTVSCLGGVANINVLIAAGLVKRLVGGYAGLVLPSPVVSGVIQRGLQEGLEVENWSLLTMIQRLMAGALGLPFMPTSSLDGSSIAEEMRKGGIIGRYRTRLATARLVW